MRLASESLRRECPVYSSNLKFHSFMAGREKREPPALHRYTPKPPLPGSLHPLGCQPTDRQKHPDNSCSHCTHEQKTYAGLHLKQRDTDTLKQSYGFVSVIAHSVSAEQNGLQLLLSIIPFPFSSLLFFLVCAEFLYVVNKSCPPHFFL